MVQLYQAKGLSKEDAETVIKIFSKDTSLFVDIMMKEELELMPPDQRNIFVNSLVILISHCFFGLLPIIPLLIYDISLFQALCVAFVIIELGLIFNGVLKVCEQKGE